ncbi:hypothetical protein ACLKA6_001971 [Drosophila palustris]
MCAGHASHMPLGEPGWWNRPTETRLRNMFSFLQATVENSSEHTSSSQRSKSVLLHFYKMIPQTEDIATARDSLEVAASEDRVFCEESRCNQLQTAADVYRRIVEHLQRQQQCQNKPNAHEETLKQIWISSFTGGNIYYRA